MTKHAGSLLFQIFLVIGLAAITSLGGVPGERWLFFITNTIAGFLIVTVAWQSERIRRTIRRIPVVCISAVFAIAAIVVFFFLRAGCIVWPTTPETFEPKYVYFPLHINGQIEQLVEELGSRQAAVDRYRPLSVNRILDKMTNISAERRWTSFILLSLSMIGYIPTLLVLHTILTVVLEQLAPYVGSKSKQKKYKVALSFAGGQNRPFVEEVAEYLARELGRSDVFYDNWFKAVLSRVNLHKWLYRIYANQSLLVVAFLNKEYETKRWCRIEWSAIRTIIDAGKDDQVMLIRFDLSPISGLVPTDGYTEIKEQTSQEIAALIIERFNSLQPSATILRVPDPKAPES